MRRRMNRWFLISAIYHADDDPDKYYTFGIETNGSMFTKEMMYEAATKYFGITDGLRIINFVEFKNREDYKTFWGFDEKGRRHITDIDPLKRLYKTKKPSLKRIAELTGISVSNLHNILSGRKKSPKTLDEKIWSSFQQAWEEMK